MRTRLRTCVVLGAWTVVTTTMATMAATMAAQTPGRGTSAPTIIVRGSGGAPARRPATADRSSRAVPPVTAPELFAATPFTYAPRYPTGPRARSRRFSGAPGFFFGPAPGVDADISPESSAPPEAQSGDLYLAVEPRTARIYVDGEYRGTVEEVAHAGVMLAVGPHRVQLQASGYEALTLDVDIAAGAPARFRGALSAVRQPADDVASPPLPHVPEMMYVIPGCYVGNRPPSAVRLPSTCDTARVRTFVG